MRYFNNDMTRPVNNDEGFVLVIALVMMLVLSVLGIAALNTTSLELQISGNDRQEKQIFYGTESGCRRGGQWLQNLQLEQVPEYVDDDLMADYLDIGSFDAALKVRDITKEEEANLGDSSYNVKYEYNIAESVSSTTGNRLDCQPSSGNSPEIQDCYFDVSCNSVVNSGGARVIDMRIKKPTEFYQ